MTVATIPTSAVVAYLDDPIATQIRAAAPQFAPFLPQGYDVENIVAQVFLEVQRVPTLAKCTPASIVSAASRLVQWGFDIGRTGYLVPFKGVATPVPGFKGLIEMILASGAARTCHGKEVYEGDFFEYEFGTEARLKHVPGGKNPRERGKMTHFYVMWQVKYGVWKFDVMTVDEVEAIRQKYSHQWKSGPLEAWYGIKTVIRRSSKQLPQNPKLAKFFAAMGADEEAEFGQRILTVEAAEITPASDVPAAPTATAAVSESETGESATPKQIELIERLSKSHHWTEVESKALVRRVNAATKQQAMTLIDNATATMAEREKVEAAAKKAAKEEEKLTADDLPF